MKITIAEEDGQTTLAVALRKSLEHIGIQSKILGKTEEVRAVYANFDARLDCLRGKVVEVVLEPQDDVYVRIPRERFPAIIKELRKIRGESSDHSRNVAALIGEIVEHSNFPEKPHASGL
jgi:hypothetical protein